MNGISRRNMLAGTAVAAFAASSALAQNEPVSNRSLAGKTFLISGTSSGFGRLGAEHYARLGAKVFATMRNLPRPEADELRRVAAADNLDLHILQLDILSDEQVQAAVVEAERINGGPIDVLVNNAGIAIPGPIEFQDLEATRLAFETNVFGGQRLIRAVLPGMRRRGNGLIVNMTSQAGRIVVPSMGMYSPTKFAFEALGEQLAYELAPLGIDVSMIEPGAYPTKILTNMPRYTGPLLARSDRSILSAYPKFSGYLRDRPAVTNPSASFMPNDPMDVPRAIAQLAMLPPGQRPLRRPVNVGPVPQEPINRASAEAQRAFVASQPWAAEVDAILTRQL